MVLAGLESIAKLGQNLFCRAVEHASRKPRADRNYREWTRKASVVLRLGKQ